MANIKVTQKLLDDLKDLFRQHPQFKHIRDDRGWFYIVGKMQTNGKQVFDVEINIPRTYPLVTPSVFVPDKKYRRLKDAPHYYHYSKRLCLYKDHEWLASPMTLLWLVGRIAKWLNKWEMWEFTGGTGRTDPQTGKFIKGVWAGKDAHFPEKHARRKK